MDTVVPSWFVCTRAWLSPCARSTCIKLGSRRLELRHARSSAHCRARLATDAVDDVAAGVAGERMVLDTAERPLIMDGNDGKVYFPRGSFNYAVTHAYDGGAYKGWQLQLGHGPNAHSIQGEIEKALCRLTGESREDLNMCCSGRTDTGVHATGQVAHFRLHKPAPDLPKFLRGLNALLPADIRALALRQVPPEFHARYSCVAKTYIYHISNTVVADPFRRHLSWHFPYYLDVDAMRRAAAVFEGTHDFTALSNKPRLPSQERDPVKHIMRMSVSNRSSGGSQGVDGQPTLSTEGTGVHGRGDSSGMGGSRRAGLAGDASPACGGQEITVEVTGNGFLYRMVRRMVGVLVSVGNGSMSVEDVMALLESRDRSRAPKLAPAHGLFLAECHFDGLAVFEQASVIDSTKYCQQPSGPGRGRYPLPTPPAGPCPGNCYS